MSWLVQTRKRQLTEWTLLYCRSHALYSSYGSVLLNKATGFKFQISKLKISQWGADPFCNNIQYRKIRSEHLARQYGPFEHINVKETETIAGVSRAIQCWTEHCTKTSKATKNVLLLFESLANLQVPSRQTLSCPLTSPTRAMHSQAPPQDQATRLTSLGLGTSIGR